MRYRRKVVRQNLLNAFPDKSTQEIIKIEKGFYRYFIDFIFESIKAVSISKKEVTRRTVIKNPELLNSLYAQNKNIIVTAGHYNNWEFYALSLPNLIQFETYSIYQPLKNNFYDNILFRSRTRNGMKLIATKDIIPFFSSTIEDKKLVVIVNDQSPSHPKQAHWNKFLNQDTGWNTGPEKLARKFDYVVLFGNCRRLKRGYYEVEFSSISDDPRKTAEGEITDKYSILLESLINEKPQYWLWSHKRWKHQQHVEQ